MEAEILAHLMQQVEITDDDGLESATAAAVAVGQTFVGV